MAPTSPPAPTPVIVLPGSTLSTITTDDDDQPSRCNDQQLSNTTNAHTNSTKTKKTSVSYNIDSLLQENNALREKINELEEQLMFQRETSIPFPNESSYNYLKGICSMYDQSQREESKKLVELSNKLPCSDIEIKLAKKSSPACTINNLIKCCLKDIELVEMSYEKLKAKDATLSKDIHEPLMKNDKPTTVFAPDTNSVDFNIVDGNSVNRRSCPTSSDIAASMMIFKVRRLQNNKDIDLICKLLNTFNIKNVPISMKSVETKLHRKFSLKEYFKCYYICSECGSSNTNYAKKCPNCDVSNLVEFYLYPVKQQIQQLLLVKGFYEKLKK
ncbi:unnamed protein product [Rotaria magnacalcarata]|uniref:Uncharacterized protein n=1 Tax=Rotaria magnacalcarata TaxID=392030 RepID=A0A816PFC2_9BILA|nr:unnamed protein product [Rotaria magnacalcarata]